MTIAMIAGGTVETIDEAAFLQQLEDRETSMLLRCSDSMRRATTAAAAEAGVSREEWLRAAIRERLDAGLR